MKRANFWKLLGAKAKFLELVRKALAGTPQKVAQRGNNAAPVVSAEGYKIRRRHQRRRSMADFIAGSKEYIGVLEGVNATRAMGDVGPRRMALDEKDV
jgi:prevent-host-death family protein